MALADRPDASSFPRERHDASGRDATTPGSIPARGWKELLGRVAGRLKTDHVSLLAAGVAFKALLALFPAIVAAISIWGLVASPTQITSQLTNVTTALPESAATLLEDQMDGVASGGSQSLSIALVVSILLALWSASGGVAGLIEGCNAAYDEVDQRKFPVKRGLALLLTVGAIVFLIVTVGLIVVLPAALGALGLGPAGELAIQVGTWPLLAVVVATSFVVLYKIAPDRDTPKTQWVRSGAMIATVLWLIGSALFTLFVNNFGTFGETYGAFAGIIVLMLWLMLSAFVVLLGPEINAESERQTAIDTTVGTEQPRGSREARVADTVPEDRREVGRNDRPRP